MNPFEAVYGRRARRMILRTVALVAALAVLSATPVSAQVADSLARGLDSSSVATRSVAVAGLAALGAPNIPASVRTRLITLLETEGTTQFATATDTADGDELFSGYLESLASLVVQFQDTRALRGLCLGGLDVSRDIQIFIQQNAAASFPYLEEAWTKPLRQQGTLETWGRILGAASTSLSSSQLATIRQHVVSASTTYPIGFLWAVSLGQLADLTPVVQSLAANSTDSTVKNRAAAVQAPLIAAQAAMSNSELLTLSQAWVDGACQGVTGLKQIGCRILHDELGIAINHVGGNAAEERVLLDGLIVSANIAVRDGNVSAAVGNIVVSNATLVRSRL
jgi:hypothetical protein